MVERIGSGIKRIYDLMESAKLPAPEFSIEGMFVAILKQPNQRKEGLGEELSKNQISIITAMIENNKITQGELAAALKLSTTSIENNIKKIMPIWYRC